MTPSGIEPATCRFVAQYLNRCATISSPHLGIDRRIILKRIFKNSRNRIGGSTGLIWLKKWTIDGFL
jgi:hypothetical protein